MAAILRVPGAKIVGPPPPLKDSRLTKGSLLLLDPSHPSSPWGKSTTPGTSVPNIAGYQAGSIGVSAQSVSIFSTASSSNIARIQLLPSGSLHLDTSQTVDVVGERVGFTITNSLAEYFYANTSHSYYVGLAVDITRIGAAGQTVGFIGGIFQTDVYGNGASAAIGMLSTGVIAASPSSSSADRLGFSSQTYGQTVWGAVSASKLSLTGPPTTKISAAGPYNGTSLHRSGSFILRSLYIEDLTVSNRTHSVVSELDKAAVSAAVSSRWSVETATPLV